MLTKRTILSLMLMVSQGSLASEKAHELYDSIYGEKTAPDVISTLHKMAELGDVDAQSLLGWEYYQPRYDTKPDVQEAIKWFELAAKQGDGEAQLALGKIYYDGELVRVDYAKAYALFNQAAQQGVSFAWSWLGMMYANGQYVEVDCIKAKEYLAKGVHIYAYDAPKDFLAACRKDMIDRKTVDNTLPVLTVTGSGMRDNFMGESFSCMESLFAKTNKLGEVANLRVTFSIRSPSGKETNQTVGFAPFGLNRLNINFTDYVFGSFTSNSSLILYKADFARKSCANIKTTIVAATATINGKDVELLKAGAIHQKL
ncbi:sel1 repeat family protein [Escherichia coli]|uniref:tetratricopeptide repeat protein n=1 Tax=Escherichia sp. MOD1-EC7003 TaxID=2093900 RepID=UPI000CF7A973|nr:tetratricopeptide repeat protein [Escherichia sp. MOD1-EC7003]EGO8359424.1 sel1 repeat family protein [Escherichia coli]EGO8376862.1 sel1 repeat family protein [Escherichia coli]MCH0694664.1 sel1 repeat family protein [Escherichia coli]